MRNLLLLHAHQQHNPDQLADLVRPHIVVDQNRPHIAYVAAAHSIHRLDTIAHTSQLLHRLDDADVLVDLQHLSLNDELCLAMASGDVGCISLVADSARPIETVGFCAGGIRRMAWSPDQEAVAFVTGDGALIVMDTMYTPVAECVLSETGFGDGAFVNVGWGAKETQFHGTEGKAARYVPVDQAAQDEASRSATAVEEQRSATSVEIVWRGDAEFFAVSFVGEKGRGFKVFDKEGTLQFTSEPAVGLAANICWRPSGTWLAVPQVLSNKYVVALFEKNGLKHREIVLPFGVAEERVTRLEWSSDSDVLAIETCRVTAGGASRVYLYTMGNYHWYQKQTLDFAVPVLHFVWDTQLTEGKRLHVLCEDGLYVVYRWIAEISGSRTLGADDEAVVAVVDGRTVRLTGCRGAVVPPPMCSLELKLEQHVNWVDFVAFVGDKDREEDVVNRMVTVDAENTVRVFSCHTTNGLLKEVRAIGAFKTQPIPFPLGYTHWLYLTANTILYATTATATSDAELHLCQLVDEQVKVIARKPVSGQIHRLAAISCTEIAVTTSAGLFRIPLDKFHIADHRPTPVHTYPDTVEHLCITAGGQHIFALKPKHWLYLNGRSIATGITSMHLTEQYLLITTLDVLRFVRLADGEIVGDRRVERGSRLVMAVPRDCRTVLQMPRGNLEAIQPRVLSLCIIGGLLDDGQYHRAFDAMRKQRINLNLLIDHDAATSLGRVDAFVRSVNNAHWLNLFLSDLDEADVTVTMYGSNYPGRVAQPVAGGKVDEVCRRVRDAIETLEMGGPLLLPILTSYVKQKELEQALQIVWNLKQQESTGVQQSAGTTDVSAADALKYLLYLVDVNQLYNVALGMYDFGLVKFVATKSQKDPKEYLPVLSGLQQIDDLSYRKFRIDVLLKRFDRALAHIVGCGDERVDECVELVAKHSLYTQALRLMDGRATDDVCYARVVRSFAEHLREAGKFRDACLMYERCGDYAQAILSARHILDWQKSVSLARRMGQTEEEIAQLVGSLIPALVENGNRQDAAQLVLKYQGNVAHAVTILCDGKFYVQALFEAQMSDETLIESIIRPHLLSYADTIVSVLNADRDQFVEHKLRLATIRTERSAARLAGGDPDNDLMHAGDADLDAFSDTSSMRSSRFSASSRGTGKTHRSSKNRRKHERKLLSLKPGNPFEDIALVDALHGLAHKAFDQQTGVRALGKALIDQRLDAEGRRVQQTLRALLRTVSGSLDEIWIAEMMVSGDCVPLAEDGRLDYSLVQQEQHYAMIKPHQRYKPLLKAIDWEFDVLE